MKNNSPSGKTDKYSNDIMELTRDDQPEPVRTIAEAMGLMMVKVEAREYRLELMVKELEELNGKIRQSAINTVSAVADAFDAMTTDRPYQKGMSPESALGILKKHAGKKWDKKCVAAFESVIN